MIETYWIFHGECGAVLTPNDCLKASKAVSSGIIWNALSKKCIVWVFACWCLRWVSVSVSSVSYSGKQFLRYANVQWHIVSRTWISFASRLMKSYFYSEAAPRRLNVLKTLHVSEASFVRGVKLAFLSRFCVEIEIQRITGWGQARINE